MIIKNSGQLEQEDLIVKNDFLDIQLKNLKKINFIIGNNGSGKSFLLESLQARVEKDSKLIAVSDTTSKNYIDYHNSDLRSLMTELMLKTSQVECNVDADVEIVVSSRTREVIRSAGTRYSLTLNGKETSDDTINKIKPSLGTRKYLRFVELIDEIINEDSSKKAVGNSSIRYVLIDELENSLNPILQKHLINLLYNKYKDCDIKFIIATHSAHFVAEASKSFPDCAKVYFVAKLKCVDLSYSDSENNKGINTEAAFNGYSPSTALIKSHLLLGSHISDYLPRNILFCEESVKTLLEAYNKKYPIGGFDFAYICCGGDANTITNAKMYECLLSYSKNFDKNFFYRDFYIAERKVIFIDDDKIKTSIALPANTQLVILKGKECLEDIYGIEFVKKKLGDTAKDLKTPAELNKILAINHRELGTIKADLARSFVANLEDRCSDIEEIISDIMNFNR